MLIIAYPRDELFLARLPFHVDLDPDRFVLFVAMLLVLTLVAGCKAAAPAVTPAMPTPTVEAATATPLPPTATSTATLVPPTATAVPATATVTPLPPLTGRGGGVIAFESDRDGNRNLYVMNADGSDQRRLTADPGSDTWSSWSPDGQYIVFQSQRSGKWHIYVLDVHGGAWADESQVRQLTFGSGDWEPAWSPDGTRIAFSQMQSNGTSDICLMNPDGTERERLTINQAIDGLPDWSPDGKRIAYMTDRDGNWEIYTMNRDGSDPRRLTNNDANDYSPTWSPD